MASEETTNDIVDARLRRAEAQAALVDGRQHSEVVNSVWARVVGRVVENGFGEEYEMTPIVPRKVS